MNNLKMKRKETFAFPCKAMRQGVLMRILVMLCALSWSTGVWADSYFASGSGTENVHTL